MNNSLLGYRVKVYSLSSVIGQGRENFHTGIVIGEEGSNVDIVIDSSNNLLTKFPKNHIDIIGKVLLEELCTHPHEYIRELGNEKASRSSQVVAAAKA